MHRFALFFGSILVASQLGGCGFSEPTVPEDKSNLPPEVKAEEERFEAANAKAVADRAKQTAKP